MAAAAMEAFWDTDDPAAFTVVALFDKTGKKETWSLKIPYLLSFLYYSKPSGQVEGLNNLQKKFELKNGPGNYIPPIVVTFWMFRIMVGVGLLMVAITAYALYLPWKKWQDKPSRWLKFVVWSIPLPYIANTAGWILTETTRQPWVVYGLLRTKNGISPNLTPGMVLISLIGFALIYAIFMVVDVYLLKSFATAYAPASNAEAHGLAESESGY